MIEFEQTYEVKSTKQYNIFRNIIGNRSIDFKNLERLKLSIKKIVLGLEHHFFKLCPGDSLTPKF